MKQELRTTPQHISFYCGVSVAQSLVFSVVFCRPMFDPMSYFVWPVYCMSFFDVCPRITPLFDPMSYFVWPVYCMSFFDVCPRITPLFDPMSYFVWPVYCMSVFDVCPWITPLISSNFSVKFT
jgi:hypothetical protein